MDIKKLINKMSNYTKDPKKLTANLIIIFLFGVLLILIGDISTSMSNKKVSDNKNTVEVNADNQNTAVSSTYEDTTRRDLIEVLSEIEGVGKISVMIYFEGGSSSVPAMNQVDNTTRTEEKDNQGGSRVTTENNKNHSVVLISDGGSSKPFIVKQYNPSIGGVAVIAEGAENAVVKERLSNAVRTVFNLPANKVSIMPMKKDNIK